MVLSHLRLMELRLIELMMSWQRMLYCFTGLAEARTHPAGISIILKITRAKILTIAIAGPQVIFRKIQGEIKTLSSSSDKIPGKFGSSIPNFSARLKQDKM